MYVHVLLMMNYSLCVFCFVIFYHNRISTGILVVVASLRYVSCFM